MRFSRRGRRYTGKGFVRWTLCFLQPLSRRRQTAATAPPAGEPAPLHAAGDGVRLAVPGKHIGLTLFLVLSDRCGNCRFPSSATGGGNLQFLDVPLEKQKTRLTEGVFGDTIPANKGFDGEQRRFSAQRGQAIGCKPPRRKRQADRSRAGRRQCRPG